MRVMVVEFRKLQNDVFNFAEENGILEHMRDDRVKTKFILWMSMLGFVKKRAPINVNEFINKYVYEYTDWFLFINEYKNGKTIGEIYAERNNLKEEKNEISKIKRKASSFLLEIEEVEDNGLKVTDLIGSKKLFIRDKTLPSKVKKGWGLIGILIPYSNEYYFSGRVELIGKGEIAKIKKKIGFIKEFEKYINEFLDYNKSQGISGKTLRKYYDALSFFKDFLEGENVTNIGEIKTGHIKKFLKWSKREILNYSINMREEHLTTLRKFFKYLYEKGYINNNTISDYITTL
jgi:hypothetical protein